MPIHKLNNPIVPHRPLNAYKILSFDIYGTLVDWEGGVRPHVLPLQSYLAPSHPLKIDQARLIRAWDAVEVELKRDNPTMRYDQLLAQSLKLLARRDLGIKSSDLSDEELNSHAVAFANSVKYWHAFPDTVQALHELQQLGYKLVPLSNIDNASFKLTNENALNSVQFDAVFTGEDIGSYKPDHRNFFYLFEKGKEMFGAEKADFLHVAHGIHADHAPAKQLGLQSVWIERKGSISGTKKETEEGLKKGEFTFGWWADTLGDLVEEIKREEQVATQC